MREFYVLTASDKRSDADLEVVDTYDLGDFDVRTFWTGNQFAGNLPRSARVWVGNGKPSDYLANPMSWEIISDKLWSIFRQHSAKSVQVLSVPLYRVRTEERVSGYKLLNPLLVLKALAPKTKPNVQDLVLDVRRIPEETHIFRLAGSTTVTLVSDSIYRDMKGKGLKGVGLIPTRSVG